MTFTFQNEPWSVSAVDAMKADLGEQPEAVVAAWLGRLSKYPRPLAIARALYGIHPCVPPPDTDPKSLRVRSRLDAMDEFGLTRQQLQDEVDVLRGILRAANEAATAEPQTPVAASHTTIEDQTDLPLETDEDVISRYGFEAYRLNDSDRRWLIGRLTDGAWVKALGIKLTADLAQQSITNALEIRRLRAAQAGMNPGNKEEAAEYRALAKSVAEAEGNYRDQVKQLEELAPFLNLSGKGVAIHGGLSLITEALQEWYKDGSRRLIDGVFTAANVQVLLRTSAQVEEPQYRLGYVVYLNAAREGLLDPHWKNPFDPETLRAMDHGFKGAFARATPKSHQPDLKDSSPDGEYRDFVAAGKTD